jgi:hypothetical protein
MRKALLPSIQRGGAHFGWQIGIIREVVHRSAEGIEDHHIGPPFLRQDAQGERQVRFRAPSDLRSV